LQTLYVEPTSVFNIQYSVYMLFMVLVGGTGTIEGLASDRFGWSLLPVGYRVRQPRG
jgi:ABC-type branched-subunit amino acid transport system permease subunit